MSLHTAKMPGARLPLPEQLACVCSPAPSLFAAFSVANMAACLRGTDKAWHCLPLQPGVETDSGSFESPSGQKLFLTGGKKQP